MAAAQDVGRYGEQVAVEYLEGAGLRVLARNWRCRAGEIDIVAADGACLVVCEVKTRRSERAGTAVEAVTPRKLARLRRLTGAWLSAQDQWWPTVRIDVLAVTADVDGDAVVEHLKAVG